MKRLLGALFAIALAGGCESVVDGTCADGYSLCDGRCVPGGCGADSGVTADARLDALDDSTSDGGADSAVDDTSPGDATLDGSSDSLPSDSTLTDGAPIDSSVDGAVSDSASDTTVADSTVADSTVADTTVADTTVADTTVVDTATPDTGVVDTGIVDTGCPAPTSLCSGVCVDLDVDPNNCGTCGKVCPTGLCNGGKCRGAKAGHVVVVGHDFVGATPALAVSRVLVNAVFLPSKNPVRVLSLEAWANTAAVGNAKAILDDGAIASGRTYSKTVSTTVADFRDKLLIDNYDVALVFDQPSAPAGALATAGTDAKISLDSFSRVGGVVVVLDGGSGTSEMPQFLTASTMLATSGHVTVTGKAVDVIAPTDAVGLGVLSPYSAPTRSVSFTVTEPSSTSLVTVVSEPTSSKPVVLHKVVFK